MGILPTSETGFKVSITHLILPRAPSHALERSIVLVASSTSRSAPLVDEIAAIGVAGGESVSELAGMPGRVVLDSWTTGDFVNPPDLELSTSVDLKPAALMDKTGLKVVFGDTVTAM